MVMALGGYYECLTGTLDDIKAAVKNKIKRQNVDNNTGFLQFDGYAELFWSLIHSLDTAKVKPPIPSIQQSTSRDTAESQAALQSWKLDMGEFTVQLARSNIHTTSVQWYTDGGCVGAWFPNRSTSWTLTIREAKPKSSAPKTLRWQMLRHRHHYADIETFQHPQRETSTETSWPGSQLSVTGSCSSQNPNTKFVSYTKLLSACPTSHCLWHPFQRLITFLQQYKLFSILSTNNLMSGALRLRRYLNCISFYVLFFLSLWCCLPLVDLWNCKGRNENTYLAHRI